MTLIFVYGTLKESGSNHRYLAGQTFIGAARTQPGFALFSLGDYPGLVPWPLDRDGITGEVWAVSDPALRQIDLLEGLAEGLYRRGSIPLAAPFENTTVETYFYLRNLDGAPRLGTRWPV